MVRSLLYFDEDSILSRYDSAISPFNATTNKTAIGTSRHPLTLHFALLYFGLSSSRTKLSAILAVKTYDASA
uniref:Uncharacterized protein n=1 Tax=Panagrellus redivivus TaxID=6233 RepID=A0A7E4ZU95_PANRE